MSTQLKGGKKPLSQKTKPIRINHDDIFGNPLGLDPEMVKLIEAKGHSFRFINALQYKNFGHHPAHWRPISRKKLAEWGYDTMDAHSFIAGSSPDDFIYRGQDLVLATRPKEVNDRHAAYLRQEARDRSFANMKEADKLRDLVRSQGIDAKITDGYEDEGEEVEE